MVAADRGPVLVPCTLVYVSPYGTSPNNPSGDAMSYVRQAVTLARSLVRTCGLRLTIFTNEPDRVRAVAAELAGADAPDVESLAVRSDVPGGMQFHGAHFKLDLIEQLARRLADGELGVLLDTDVVAMRPLDATVLGQCAATGLGGYDITGQVSSSVGARRLFDDLTLVAGRSLADPRWFGGELLIGRKDTLGELARTARETFETYLAFHKEC